MFGRNSKTTPMDEFNIAEASGEFNDNASALRGKEELLLKTFNDKNLSNRKLENQLVYMLDGFDIATGLVNSVTVGMPSDGEDKCITVIFTDVEYNMHSVTFYAKDVLKNFCCGELSDSHFLLIKLTEVNGNVKLFGRIYDNVM